MAERTIFREPMSTPQSDLYNGGRATIVGLLHAKHLNGRKATLVHFNATRQRWRVKIDGERESMMRPENLVLITNDAEDITDDHPPSYSDALTAVREARSRTGSGSAADPAALAEAAELAAVAEKAAAAEKAEAEAALAQKTAQSAVDAAMEEMSKRSTDTGVAAAAPPPPRQKKVYDAETLRKIGAEPPPARFDSLTGSTETDLQSVARDIVSPNRVDASFSDNGTPPPLGPPADTKIVAAGFVGEMMKLLKLDGCCFNAGNIAA